MKKFLVFLVVLFVVIAGWFLFFKPGDFTAKIKAKTNIGTIEQSIKNWKKNAPIIEVDLNGKSARLVQQFTAQDSTHLYEWTALQLNDSLSEITVHVTDPQNSMSNRIQGLFKETDFKRKSKSTVLEFNDLLQDHLERINVTIDGETILPAKFYAYTELEAPQILKANGMMKDISHLQNTMARFNVKLDGQPFVRITDWNRTTDSLKYEFAFPLVKTDSLPEVIDIKYASLPEQKTLKATYNGNYITSDRAWYALLDYAKSNNIKVDPRPIEVFYNNPSMGGDESRWKAEIYMPIIE